MENLAKYDGYISGSFACNVVYNTTYNCSDIDIYFSDENNANNFGDTLIKYEYLLQSVSNYTLYSVLGTHIDKIITYAVLNPKKKSKKIQLIIINKNIHIINYIMGFFDINHCKNVIDGNYNFYSYNNDTKYNKKSEISQHILNVFELFKFNINTYKNINPENEKMKSYYKYFICNVNEYIRKVSNRITKYTTRGIIFTNIEIFNKLIVDINSICPQN
jgi:hypothetical protein